LSPLSKKPMPRGYSFLFIFVFFNTIVTLLLHCCYTVAALSLHCCYTVVAP
jgi:hypothetical protein